MRYLSVCSGIEAATVAFHPLGWEPLAFSEIEPFPCKVLAHHYPNVPNLGDMTKFHEWGHYEPDLLVGGTPCQSFSIAGLRKGLDDPRGNLMLTYLSIADRYKPKWLLWENVPGVLSSNGGRDFGTFLGALGKIGYGFAYRVLDAQYCRTHEYVEAVPQRRRRVFVVGHIGDWRRAAAVLFDSESLRGNPPPSREAGKEVAGTFTARTKSGGWGTDVDLASSGYMRPVAPSLVNNGDSHSGFRDEHGLVSHSLRGEGFDASEDGTGRGTPIVTCMAHGQGGAEITEEYAPTLNCNHEQPIAFDTRQITSKTNRTRAEPGLPNGTLSKEGTPCVAYGLPGNWIGRRPENGGNATEPMRDVSPNLTSTDRHAAAFSCKDSGADVGEVSPTLRSMGHDKSYMNGGGGQVAVAFSAGNSGDSRGIGYSEEHTPPLRAGASGTNQVPTVAFAQNTRDEIREMEVPGALAAQPGMKQTSYLRQGMMVRRLLPIECEKLQGFPPNYTNIPGASDSARYKALGNSMAVNCMSLLGQRIAMVDALP